MSNVFAFVRIIHIACGMVALFVAPAALMVVKGGPAHRRWGKLYFWMMAVVAITAMYMSIYRPIFFLGLVAVFSFYQAFGGYRNILRKNRPASALDWSAALATLAGSLGLVALGFHPIAGQFMPAPLVSMVFGVGGVVLSGLDIIRFIHIPSDKKQWLYRHIAGMLGSYIATVSAFSAVNFRFLPIVLRWTWPSIVGVPAIVLWIYMMRRKSQTFLQKGESFT